jgi:hypothetical protein
MGYEAALGKAWDELAKLNPGKDLSIKFLSDEYSLDLSNRKVISLSCNIPAKDFTAVLILHYLNKRLSGLPHSTGEWLSFKELEAGEIYYPAFRKRAIEPLIRKYGGSPKELFSVLERLPGERAGQADAGIIIEALPGVRVMIIIWRGDEEFGPEANMLFDKNIAGIFCSEDIAVLAGFIAAKI